MTKRSEELIEDALALLPGHGLAPSIRKNGKHIKIKWLDAGRRHALIVSRTPGDNRARQSSRATLRRILRNANQSGGPR